MNRIDLLFETRRSWTDFQINFLIALIYKVEKKDRVFKPYTLKAKDILVEKLSFEELKIETQSLLSQTYEVQIGNHLTQLSIFSSITYIIGESIVEINLHPLFKTYFLHLKDNYTLVTLKNLLKFKSIFSKKMYLILKKSKEAVVNLTIEMLKDELYLKESYQDYNTFKKRVILQAQKELHNTDMAFFFEEVKKSRKIETIIFKQVLFDNIELSILQKELQNKLIKDTKITESQSRKIVIKFMPQEIYATLYMIKHVKQLGQIKTSLAGYTVGVFNQILFQKN